MILGEARVKGLKEIFKFSLVFLTKLLAVCCQDLFLSELVDRQGKQRQKFILHLAFHLCDNRNAPTGCSSGVEPTSCYQKVASLIPLVCMSKCPWAKTLNPKNCSSCAGQHLAWQPPPSPSVYEYMYELL